MSCARQAGRQAGTSVPRKIRKGGEEEEENKKVEEVGMGKEGGFD